MGAETNDEDIEQVLEQLRCLAAEKINTCEYRSAFERNGILRKKAKLESHAAYYLDGTFFQMDQAQYLLHFDTMRERAIELIALLGDFETILKIQPDLPQEVFDELVYRMTPCAYENLAEATGVMEGFNSDGMHSCIADGLSVCRAVGKMTCVNCFREYACDVYIAADDLELAQHQCRTVVDFQGEWSARGNRRWLAQSKMAWIEAMQGQIASALSLQERAISFTNEQGVSVPLDARVQALLGLDALRILLGEDSQLEKDPVLEKLPAGGECVLFEMKRDWNSALKAVVAKDYVAADQLYLKWDNKLREARASHLWSEIRLRRIACSRLAGATSKLEALAESVEEQAKGACDWLTIRRLNEVIGSSKDPSPLAVAAQAREPATVVGALENTSDQDWSARMKDEPVISASIQTRIEELQDQIQHAFQDQDQDQDQQQIVAALESVIRQLLAVTVDQMETWEDSAICLNLAKSICEIFVGDHGDEIWKWANSLVVHHQKNATLVSLLASVGHKLLAASNDQENGRITVERLQQLFKRSLQLDDSGPGTWSRAGDFFADLGDVGEAERCFARSFKLNRLDGRVAVSLANVYRDTDRPRDALHVLDLCLREGTPETAVALEAAITAFEVEQYKSMLTYLDQYATSGEGNESSPIPHYYAFAHLKLNNPAEALKFIQLESEYFDQPMFHCQVLRACANFDMKHRTNAAIDFENAVRQNLSELQISRLDVFRLLQLLYEYELNYNQLPELGDVLHDKLLSTGLMPDDYFDRARRDLQTLEGLQFYKVLISQPLDESWANSPGCLADQASWDHYIAEWGVLAASEEDASELVIAVQHRCFRPVAPRIIRLERDSGPYTDSPGIIWQGLRRAIPLEDLETPSDQES